MAKKMLVTWCKTNTCINNNKGVCKENTIYIEHGRCGCMKSKTCWNADGTFKR